MWNSLKVLKKVFEWVAMSYGVVLLSLIVVILGWMLLMWGLDFTTWLKQRGDE